MHFKDEQQKFSNIDKAVVILNIKCMGLFGRLI